MMSEQEITTTLQDCGLDAVAIKRLADSYRSADWPQVTDILRTYRCNLLQNVHIEQEKLYCLDFLLRKLNSEQKKTKGKKMIFDEFYTLSNGVRIPKLGLGTWMIEDSKAAQAVREAVKIGYRHIDTAEGYGNENGVGQGIRACGLKREEIFLTTKLEAAYKTYAEAQKGIDGSLKALELDYIDLMIIHSPQPWTDFREGEHFFEGNLEAWRALEDAYKAGKIRAIGVSNFEEIDLDNILNNCTVKPVVNQILAHIGNTPFDLIKYCQNKDILVEAYSPIAHGEIIKHAEIAAIAEKYNVTIPQICIRYCLQLGLLPLPKTANPEHMKSNAAVNFEISAADMETLKSVKRLKNYGEASIFPVFGGKMNTDGTCVARDLKG